MLKHFLLLKQLPMQFNANILLGIEHLFFVWFWCSFFFRFLIKLSFSSMSTDLTTESSIYLAIIMTFLFWGQVSDYRLLIVNSVDILMKDNLIRKLKKKLHQNQTKNKCSIPKSIFALNCMGNCFNSRKCLSI
jgi:hypothetical protein